MMNIKVREVLARKGDWVETIHVRATVLDAVTRLNERKIGALLVTDADRPTGLLTERDILTRVIANRMLPEVVQVGEVMTRRIVVVDTNATIGDAMAVMTEKRCRHLPVVDDDGVVCGMLSIGDLMGWHVHDQERTIADLEYYICH